MKPLLIIQRNQKYSAKMKSISITLQKIIRHVIIMGPLH